MMRIDDALLLGASNPLIISNTKKTSPTSYSISAIRRAPIVRSGEALLSLCKAFRISDPKSAFTMTISAHRYVDKGLSWKHLTSVVLLG